MKHTWKQIVALCLSMVLVVALLPAFPAEAAAGDLTSEGIVLAEDDFTKYTTTGTSEITANGYTIADSYVQIVDLDGVNVLKAGYETNSASNRYIWITADVDIPQSYSNMTFYVKLEAEVYAEGRYYLFDLNSCKDSDDSNVLGDNYKPTRLSGYSSTGNTSEFATVTSVWKVVSGIGTLKARLGAHKNSDGSSEPVYIKSYKITLLPAEVSSATASANIIAAMARADAYAKLTSDVVVDVDLTLGKNAVLDLNGHTLTVSADSSVNAGTNARIIDSSETKSGKLAVDEGKLTMANPDNPQLPLWADDGYIFTEPELGESRAFFVAGSTSADGFTLDFRPGFGEAGGENVREAYLEKGTSGITMNAKLSWTDIYGNTNSSTLPCDDIFTGMYKSQTARGRLTLTGAEQYQTISLSISLASCGVVKTFELPVFENTYVTKHYAANFNKGDATGFNNTERATVTDGVLYVAGTVYFSFDTLIATGEGKTLVIQFDLPDIEKANNFSLRAKPDSDYVGLVSISSIHAKHSTYGEFYYNSSNFVNEDPVTVRMEIDLGTGSYEVTYGSKNSTGVNTKYDAVLGGAGMFYIYTGSSSNAFDNLLVYTVDNAQ